MGSFLFPRGLYKAYKDMKCMDMTNTLHGIGTFLKTPLFMMFNESITGIKRAYTFIRIEPLRFYRDALDMQSHAGIGQAEMLRPFLICPKLAMDNR